MKRFSLAAFAALAFAAVMVGVAGTAAAADLPRPSYRPAYKAPFYVAPFSWTGFYVGINGGYGFGKSNWNFAGISTGDFDTKGGLVGGTFGYNLQTGVWVWGIEGDFDASWMKGTETTVCGVPGCETKVPWFATFRGRIGYAWDRFLPYFTGGAAFASVKMTPGIPPSATDTQVGWTVGGGLEYAFLGNWSAKLEYLYADLGKASCDVTVCGVATNVKFNTSIIRAGINYRFY